VTSIPYAGSSIGDRTRTFVADQSDIGERRVPSALFSMEAADNAEVVPPVPPPRGPDSMWSTRAPTDDEAPAEPAAPAGDAAPIDDDDPWHRMGSPTPPPGVVPPFRAPSGTNGAGGAHGANGAGMNGGAAAPGDPWRTVSRPTPPPGVAGVFSAEPVEREDVVDHDEVLAELLEDDDLGPRGPVTNPFATTRGGAPPPAPPPAAPEDPWIEWHDAGAAEPPGDARARTASPPPFSRSGDDDADHREGVHHAPRTDGTRVAEPGPDRHEGAGPSAAGDHVDDVVADQHGLDVAVARLAPHDRDVARVPLSVCGALLLPGEHVLGAVTGQMLGRPAAVVVTPGRVLIVNDRRWQPIVDVYPIDDRLVVRGRHDRSMAALSIGDDERLSMVDGIHDVELAIELAEAIRHPSATEQGAPSAF
jgi:hypothetical protein